MTLDASRLLRTLAVLVGAGLSLAAPAAAQVFQRQYDHPGRWFFPHDQVQASDGGFVVCGDSYLVDTQESRPYLMKLDASGNVAWTREYTLLQGFHHAASIVRLDHPAGDVYVVLADIDQLQRPALFAVTAAGALIGGLAYDVGAPLTMHELLRTPDGGWMMVGRTFDPVTGDDVAFLKLDALGGVQWFRRLAGSIPWPQFGGDDDGLDVLALPTGGFVVTALVESDAYVGLWDAAGVPVFARSYRLDGGFVFERVLSVLVTATGRIVVVANADLSNDRFPLILELDAAGGLVSTQVLSVPMSATRALRTSDGGFAIAGSSLITPGAQGLRLVKFDANLNRQWGWQYDATLTFATINPPANVIETADGGFLLTIAARAGLDPVQHVVKVAADGTNACNPTPLPPDFVFGVETDVPATTLGTAPIESAIVSFVPSALPVDASGDCAGSGVD